MPLQQPTFLQLKNWSPKNQRKVKQKATEKVNLQTIALQELTQKAAVDAPTMEINYM